MAGISAGLASILGAGVNAFSSWYNREQDMAMLAYQNQYNSPVEQMKRGMEAGINPNALAQGIAGSPGYGNMAPADASTLSNGIPSDLGTQLGNSVNSALNAELVKANINKTKEETRGRKLENEYEESTFDARVQQALDEGAITAAEAEKARLYAEKYPEILDLSVEQMRETIRKVGKEIDKIDQDIRESDKRIEKLEQDIHTAKSQEAKNYAEAALAREKIKNQELRNRNLEMSGSEEGWQSEYFAIRNEKGEDAADEWLNDMMAVTTKVVENSSEASSQGRQNVVDETPQGQLRKYYQDQMNEKLAPLRRQLEQLRSHHASSLVIRKVEREIEKVERKYARKMRRVDKGVSAGGSAFGFGANFGS